MGLAQMCVDQAVSEKICEERAGVRTLRKRAFEDLLDRDFDQLARYNNPVGRMKIAMLQEGLNGTYSAERRVREQVDQLLALRKAETTEEVIRKVDDFYNRLVDPEFEQEHGTLEQVLAVSAEDLKKFNWQDFLDETAEEATLEEMMRQVDSSVIPPEMEEQERKSRAKKLLVTEEAARKMAHRKKAFLPDAKNHALYDEIYRQVYRGMYEKVRPMYRDMRGIYRARDKK